MKKLLRFLFRVLSFIFGLIAAVFLGYRMFKEYKRREKLRASPEYLDVKKQSQVALNLTVRQKDIYKLIETSKKVEMRDLLVHIKGVTERTLRRDLLALQEQGLIEKGGNTKSAHYLLKDNGKIST
jgi:DNA-binding transcriptional ArsR family regulator